MSFKRYLSYVRMSFKFMITKRAMTLFWVLTKPIALLVAVAVWTAIFDYSGQGVIAGLTLEQTINYMIFSVVFGGLTSVFIGQLLGRAIHRGTLTTSLFKPVDYGVSRLFNHIGDRWIYTFIFEVLPGLFIAVVFFGFSQFSVLMTVLSMVSLFFGFIINYFLSLDWALMYFKTIEYDHMDWLKRTIFRFFSGSYLPLNFFPVSLQSLFGLLPFQFITYVPAMIFIGGFSLSHSLMLILVEVGWCVLLYSVYRVAWHFVVKNFAGVGV